MSCCFENIGQQRRCVTSALQQNVNSLSGNSEFPERAPEDQAVKEVKGGPGLCGGEGPGPFRTH